MSQTFPTNSRLAKVAAVLVATAAQAAAASAQDSPPAAAKPAAAKADGPQYVFPRIQSYGKVAPLPNAVQQPRNGSRILVDVTLGGDAAKLNPAIEKVARFVNIYAGAGKNAAHAEIAVVLHGDATLTILSDAAYARRFGLDGNPNLDCLRQLKKTGVRVVVCGQSLLGKGAALEDVVDFVPVAVSGLSALVNLQDDGFRYVPLK